MNFTNGYSPQFLLKNFQSFLGRSLVNNVLTEIGENAHLKLIYAVGNKV